MVTDKEMPRSDFCFNVNKQERQDQQKFLFLVDQNISHCSEKKMPKCSLISTQKLIKAKVVSKHLL